MAAISSARRSLGTLLLSLMIAFAWSAATADPEPMPPLGPEGDAAAPVALADPGVQRCRTLLRQLTDPARDHVDRSLISLSPRWGLVFRADISSRDHAGTWSRFVCPISGRSPTPVVIAITPNMRALGPGPWGAVTVYK